MGGDGDAAPAGTWFQVACDFLRHFAGGFSLVLAAPVLWPGRGAVVEKDLPRGA